MLKSRIYSPIDSAGRLALAEALGDTPESVIPVHRLRHGLCRAYVAGDPRHFNGAIVQDDFCPAEPVAFGSDSRVLWDLLKCVEGWVCVDVPTECAKALGEIIGKETGIRIRYYSDAYYALHRPVVRFQNAAVRQLTLDDLELLQSAQKEVRGVGFGSKRALLSVGIVACAIISGKIVAIAHTSARSDRHADIGVFCMEEWRNRGFVTAAASIVAQHVQETGQIPVWSTGESNFASRRVAQKLGFTEVSQRTYVIKEE